MPPRKKTETAPAQALAPVPAVSDEAGKGIETINTQLAEFDKVEAGITDLETKYAKVAFDCTTPKGMKDAVAARLAVKTPRIAVEHARKAAKEPVLKLGRDIDARAAAITARLVALERPIDDQIKAQELREAERKADLERRLREIVATPNLAIGKKSDELAQIVEALRAMPLEDFQEYRAEATAARAEALGKVEHLLSQAKQAEEGARALEAQRLETERKNEIQFRIGTFTDQVNTAAMCRTSARIQALIDRTEAAPIDESYQEFQAAAQSEKDRVLGVLRQMLADKQQAEADAAAAVAARAAAVPPVAPTTAAQPMKCDGNHGGPRCAAPAGQCWHDDAPAPAAHTARAPQPDADPFTTPHMRRGTAMEEAVRASMARPEVLPERPSHIEIVQMLADHYDENPLIVIGWLADLDAVALLDHFAGATA
jgi:hypothetical protein